MKCTNCIKKQLTSGSGLFGEDSDDEPGSYLKKSDPLSDSMPENKHSKSEKSLKKPLKLFQEE
jgi:hypothetical protein